MSDRFFLDTNIFLYTFDETAPVKSRKAHEFIREAITTHTGLVSYRVVQEFFNYALKRFTPPMSLVEAEQFLGAVFRPLLGAHSSQALYIEAMQLHSRWGLAWYGSLIVAAALQADCDVLFSEDLQHGQRFGGLEIVNPFL
jgi:predicted nucleic acid-binding protein